MKKAVPLLIVAAVVSAGVALVLLFSPAEDSGSAGNLLTAGKEDTRPATGDQPVPVTSKQPPPSSHAAPAPEVAQRELPSRTELPAGEASETQRTIRASDAAGQPLGGVSVFVVPAPDKRREEILEGDPADWLATGLVFTTGEDGLCPLQVREHEVAHAVIARKPGYGWSYTVLEPSAEGAGDLSLTLTASKSLYGVVVDHEDRPLAGVSLTQNVTYPYETWLSWPTAKALAVAMPREEVKSDSHGHFAFQEVNSENHDLVVEAPGYATGRYDGVAPGTQLRLTMVPGAVIHGRITNESGEPVEGVLLRSCTEGSIPNQFSEWVSSDSSGDYAIDGAHSGLVAVVLWSDKGYATDRVTTWIDPGTRVQMDFVVKRDTSIAGRLVDSTGAPVAGVHVIVQSEKGGWWVADVVSSDDGNFTAGGLIPSETYTVTSVGNKEYGHRLVRHIPAGTKELEIRVLEKGTVWGMVYFAGEPAQEVKVRIFPRKDLDGNEGLMPFARYHHETLASRKVKVVGSEYSFRNWAGVFDLEFSAPPYSRVLKRTIVIPPGRAPNRLDIEFEPVSRAEGVVIDAATEDPIAQASVTVLDEYVDGTLMSCPGALTTATDGAGRFCLDGMRQGETALRVTAAGYASRTLRNVLPVSGGAGEPLVVRLEKGGRIEGSVKTIYAAPSTTIKVLVRELGSQDGLASYVDTKGRFGFDNVPAGRVEVVLNDEYYWQGFPDVEPQVRQVEVRSGETVRVDFDAATGVILKGRVEGWDKPLLIEARRVGESGELVNAGACYTDGDGIFRIPHLLPGNYRVGSSAGQPGYSIGVATEVVIGSSTPDEVLLRVPATLLRGTVKDGAGTPVARSLVTVHARPTDSSPVSICLTDSDGGFAIGGLAEGIYDLLVRARSCAPFVVASQPVPGEPMAIVLEPEAILQVSVVDDAGQIVNGALVQVVNERSWRLGSGAVTGSDGSVRFTELQGRPHVVTARHEGYLAADPVIVPLQPGAQQDLRLVLQRAGSVVVHVASQEGRALKSVPVHIYNEEGELLEEHKALVTNQEGRARIGKLRPGTYIITAGADEGVEEEVEVLAGESVDVSFVLAAG
ncbi:MAG: carboxypeptidase regulatory-like domain-containing protein [Planctomycetota bacterium]